MKKLLLTLLFATVYIAVHAEKPPIKFGKVSKEELAMTVYEPDTSAAAVVLCKYGRFYANEYKFSRIERIKVFKKAGTKYAEFVLPGREDDTFRGRTYNLVDGEIEVTKLKRESIFKERVSDRYYRYRVALPNVKVGSVFEIESSSSGLPTEWAFQRGIPVKWCEIILEESSYINFRKKMVGYESITSPSSNRFIAKNIPAFKSESYMNSKNNYITKFEFDILSINVPGYYESFTTSWEAVNDRLMEHDRFGASLKSSSLYITDIKKEIENKNLEPLEKAKAAYEAIKSIKWNNEAWIFSSQENLNKAFKEKVGNSTDINFLLLQLFRKLDIEAYPVVISTRRNGILNPFYPSYEKLNYTLVSAVINEKEYLLDATEKELCFGMLPSRCLNNNGRVVTNQKGKWVDIKPQFKKQESVLYDLKLDKELNLVGEINYSRSGYAGYNFRQDYKEYAGDEDYLTSLEGKYSGLIIKDFTIKNIEDNDKPLQDKYTVKLSNKVERINDIIMLNPFLLEKISDNPFKLEERKYPVDFAYCRNKYLVSKITIPDDFIVSEIPKPIKIIFPDKSVSVQVMHQHMANTLTTIYKFNINKVMFLPEEYEYLKAVYEQIIKKHAEPIILKPNTDAASL
ncbi:hypothetical protein [Carboxylicivirga sp. M1479]|uniref:hypothetical protein n=1 Tax=Carboxylicivirga sp. M1479 TaxID=2594476 RepID=UPI001178A917|nr:hypothetical protein [Carboxylicivirga sp. M1479]TRX63268.1 hypothetical protein FNN09_18635 [Carboxylicivirga sp. M1479]